MRVKPKPILFNTEMVRAILDGRKSVTRRVVKPQPRYPLKIQDEGYHKGEWHEYSENPMADKFCNRPLGPQYIPPYRSGDILYVRETWRPAEIVCTDGGAKYWYYADGFSDASSKPGTGRMKWHPSIHMPKEAARLFLRVTDVRVERLQDIDDEGAKAEGANWCNGKNVGWEEKMRRSAINRFAEIWDSTVKYPYRSRYGWEANPWVWVIEFERISKEEAMANE